MKAILLSVQPKWCQMILNGDKQYEFRGNNVKNFKSGMKIYLYESLGKPTYRNRISRNPNKYELIKTHEGAGAIVGECTIKEVITCDDDLILIGMEKLGYTNQPYAIELENIVKYDTPKALSEFEKYYFKEDYSDIKVTKAPQSFMYVTEVNNV